MVQVLPPVESFGSAFGRSFGQGAGKGASEGFFRQKENQAIKKNYGLDLSGITNPETRQQIISQELIYGRKRRAAEATAGVSYAPRDQLSATQQTTTNQQGVDGVQQTPEVEPAPIKERPKKKKEKDVLASTFKKTPEKPQPTVGIPESQLSKEGISAAPQYETTGQKLPILTPQQLDQEGERIMRENNANPNNIPIDKLQGIQFAKERNNANKIFNQEVEQDQIQKQAYQVVWGQKGVEALSTVMEKPTGEMKALMMRKAEQIATDPKYNKDQSSINRQIAIEAEDLKNQISRVRNGIKAGRAVQKGKESILGKKRADEAREKDIKVKIQPLLDQGLYDTTRNLLSELKFGPEETENLITNLGEGTKKAIAEFPNINGEKRLIQGESPNEWFGKFGLKDTKMIETYDYTPEQRQQITQGIENTILADPSVNLLLLRRDLRPKGVDWDIYKDTINDLVLSGRWKPNRDQLNAMNTLETPPLDALDKITHSWNLIGL